MQEDLSTERVAKLSAETQLRQLQLTYQKQKADLEDLRMQTNMSDAKLDRARSTSEALVSRTLLNLLICSG